MRFQVAAACLSMLLVGRPAVTLAQVAESLPQSFAAPASPAAAAVIPPPDLRPRIYVKDLDHFAELVKEDATLEASAQTLVARRAAAVGVGGTLLLTGLVVTLTGMGNQSCHDSTPFPGSGTLHICEGDPTQAAIGAAITAAGVLAAAIIFPKSGDLLDIINAWNTSHPDRPFELSGGRHPTLDQVAVPTR